MCSTEDGIDRRRHVVAEYASYWENLLLAEHQETVAVFRERYKRWSSRRLEESGMCLLDARAEPDSDLFGEKIVKVYKKSIQDHTTSKLLQEGQQPQYLKDRFVRGDVLIMTTSPDALPRECLVTDVGDDWLTVGVGPTWPAGLWESRKSGGMDNVRLDRAAPQAPLRAQRFALDLIRRDKAGKAVEIMACLFSEGKNANKTSSAKIKNYNTIAGPENLDMEIVHQALQSAKNVSSFTPNKSQENAICWSLQQRVSLIRGPPGTGKTKTAALLISTAMRLKTPDGSPMRVLAVAHSNGAADVLCEALLHVGVPAVRVGRPASVSTTIQHRTVISLADRHPEILRLRSKGGGRGRNLVTTCELKQRILDVQQSICKTAPVVVTSCIGAYQLFPHGENKDKSCFPLMVLDEAAQTTEPAFLCALATARAEQVVLVGDTRQLPPTVTSMILRKTLGLSPMARLEAQGIGQRTLQVQYRMHPVLLEHPSQYFYDGLVSCARRIRNRRPVPKGFPWPNQKPLAFVQVGGHENRNLEVTHDFGGKSNPTEAELVTQIVSQLLLGGDVRESHIAVITPYNKQVQLIRSNLSMQRTIKNDITVGTVDSFQGKETSVVIFSCVRSNEMGELGFLRDSRRLCVAITRAKHGLIILGDQKILQGDRHWKALIDSCKERHVVIDSTNTTLFAKAEDKSHTHHPTNETVDIDLSLKTLFGNNTESDIYQLVQPQSPEGTEEWK